VSSASPFFFSPSGDFSLASSGSSEPLGEAVRDVVDRVVAGHVLLLQEIGGVALALGEDCDQHIGAGDFLAAGRLDVDHRALDDALEAGRGLGIVRSVGDQVLQFGIDVADEALLQLLEIDAARLHHRRRILVVDQREEEMLQRRIFVPALVGEREGPVERLFEAA
jgi:hypothetical protein